MFANATSKAPAPLALLAEGVDRNSYRDGAALMSLCRPPHGGRG